MYIDSHCHINFPELNKNIDSVLSNMKEKSITHALCVSVTLDNFQSVLKLAEDHKHIFASVGVHPDYDLLEILYIMTYLMQHQASGTRPSPIVLT